MAVKQKGSDLKGNAERGDVSGRSFDDIVRHYDKETAHPLGDQEAAGARAGQAKDDKKSLTPEQVSQAEDTTEDSGFYKGGSDQAKAADKRPWYRQLASKEGKKLLKGAVKKHKKLLVGTILLNLIVAAILLILVLVGPLKHVHFETVMRTVNYARFHLLIRKQFGRVVFEASVLTQNSVGTFRNSPLVRQIRLAIPDRQLKQLGNSDKVKFDFWPNGSFGDGIVPFRESLRGVVIDGKPFYLDDFAREQFNGKTYAQLTTREKMTVNAKFISVVMPKLNEFMKLMPRHVRWHPMIRLKQRVGFDFVKWLNRAREFAGKTPDQALALTIDQEVDRVMGPRPPGSAIHGINEGAEEAEKELVESAKEGRAPGQLRSRLAARAKTISNFSDVVFAVTASCVVREIAKTFTKEVTLERQAQAARFAADLSSTSDQQKAGGTVGEAIGASNRMWDARGSIPDAVRSVLYRQASGAAVGLEAASYAAIPWLDPSLAMKGAAASANKLLDDIAPLIIDGPLAGILKKLGIDIGGRQVNDGICAALMDQWVQYGITAVELILAAITLGTVKGVTAGLKVFGELLFHAAVGYGLAELLGFMIDMAIKHFSRLYFTGLEQGAARFDAGYVAQNSVAQVSNRGVAYGRPLTQEETNAAQQVAMGTLQAENREKPINQRYFAIDNPTSLLGLTVARMPSTAGGLAESVRSVGSFMGSILSSPFKLVGSLSNTGLLFSPAHAYTGLVSPTTTFGVEQWGYSLHEQVLTETDPSFSLRSVIANVEPRIDELNARYSECYDENYVLQAEKPEKCTAEFLSTRDALYWRYYNSLMFSATHLSGSV